MNCISFAPRLGCAVQKLRSIMTSNDRGQWKSRLGFIFAAAGSAIGLGNIWRFPYVVGEYGGSAFLGLYLLMILFLGLPVLIAEVMLGKASQRDPVGAFEVLDRKGSPWRLIGFGGVLAAFIILAFYSVVAGWCMEFIVRSAAGDFSPDAHPAKASQAFTVLTSSADVQLFYHGFFVLLFELYHRFIQVRSSTLFHFLS